MSIAVPPQLLPYGPVGVAVAPYWPEISPTTLQDLANSHQVAATQLDDAAQKSNDMHLDALLESPRAGHALQQSLLNNENLWQSHAAKHQDAFAALNAAAAIIQGLRTDMEHHIAAPNYAAHESAKSLSQAAAARGDATEAQAYAHQAQGYVTTAQSEAELAAGNAAAGIGRALDGKFGTAPPGYGQQPPGASNAVLTSYQQPITEENGSGTDASGSSSLGSNPTAASSTGQPAATLGGYGQAGTGQAQTEPALTPLLTSISSAASPSVSSTPVGSVASTPLLTNSVGSVASAPASGSAVASGAGQAASTAAAASSAPATADASSGVATAASGSGAGVTTSIGASGVLAPAMVPPQLLGGHTSSAAGGLASTQEMAETATGGVSNPSPASPADAVPGSAGGGGTAGGGSMPTPPAPLAPYSQPGAPWSPSGPPVSASAAPVGSAPGGAAGVGAGAVIAASSAGGSVGAAPAKRVNPDLDSAQQVLGGLVKACPARPVYWAVSVLRTPVGRQTLIASSIGGGAYLPPEVSVPSTVRLAVLDPALPAGWAAAWMGWQSPLAILVDHYERVANVVAGVTMSAMVTSELWPKRPDCGGDFLALPHDELVMSTAAPLVGGHRLTATDPALAARLTALNQGGDVTDFVAAQLTRAIWTAAAQPDDTGTAIAVTEDADILGLVADGAARAEHWDNYQREVERRAGGALTMPEIHAPRDADDSPGSATARMWYRHYYASGRIAEMVTCWASQPVSILDIAYCGVAAGLGAVLAAVVTGLEMQLDDGAPGLAGGTR